MHNCYAALVTTGIRDVSAPTNEADTALRFVSYKRKVTDFQVGKI